VYDNRCDFTIRVCVRLMGEGSLKAHRLLHHSRLESNEEEEKVRVQAPISSRNVPESAHIKRRKIASMYA